MSLILAFINMVSTKRLYVIELGHIIELLVVIKRTFILLEEGLFAKSVSPLIFYILFNWGNIYVENQEKQSLYFEDFFCFLDLLMKYCHIYLY